MKFFSEISGMLAFRAHALRVQAERRAAIAGAVWFIIGFLAYALVRNSVYASLPELAYARFDLLGSFLNLNLIQVLLFLLLVYIPALILLGNIFSGDGIGFSISREEYQAHLSALLPLWGVLFFVTAPVQWLVPHFLVIGIVEMSFGMFVRTILVSVYTLWAIKQLNYLSWPQAIGVFALSWFAFPILQILSSFLHVLSFFILIPLIYFGYLWIRSHFASHVNERVFQQNLHTLTVNPQDADAHYQLGLIHFKRRNSEAARRYFEQAIRIEPADPDYHYYLGRVYELKGEWPVALKQYEETYRLNPEYGLGDIFREVGKAYLQTGSIEKGMEFLSFFLKKRSSDPEGRYWLAVAFQRLGDADQTRYHLKTVLEQARSSPRFFRKENREWIYRARELIRSSGSGARI